MKPPPLGFDHVFDSGGTAGPAPGCHRRGCPGSTCRPGRTHRPRRTGHTAGRPLGHDRGTWPGARRAAAWLRPGRQRGHALMPTSGPRIQPASGPGPWSCRPQPGPRGSGGSGPRVDTAGPRRSRPKAGEHG